MTGASSRPACGLLVTDQKYAFETGTVDFLDGL